jgi:hypothetical protein
MRRKRRSLVRRGRHGQPATEMDLLRFLCLRVGVPRTTTTAMSLMGWPLRSMTSTKTYSLILYTLFSSSSSSSSLVSVLFFFFFFSCLILLLLLLLLSPFFSFFLKLCDVCHQKRARSEHEQGSSGAWRRHSLIVFFWFFLCFSWINKEGRIIKCVCVCVHVCAFFLFLLNRFLLSIQRMAFL